MDQIKIQNKYSVTISIKSESTREKIYILPNLYSCSYLSNIESINRKGIHDLKVIFKHLRKNCFALQQKLGNKTNISTAIPQRNTVLSS